MKKKIMFLWLLLGVLGLAQAEGSTQLDALEFSYQGSIQFNGQAYPYKVYPLAGATEAVIALHGMGMNGEQMESLTGFHQVADAVVVYPTTPDGFWSRSEAPVIAEIIDILRSQHGVARIYVTGISNGGMMSYDLACELPNDIDAIAPVASLMQRSITLRNCNPQVPFLLIHGTADGIFKWGGTFWSNSATGTMDFWTDCASPTVEQMPNLNVQDGTTVWRADYCGTPLYAVVGGSHHWPGANGSNNFDIDATDLIWNWFQSL